MVLTTNQILFRVLGIEPDQKFQRADGRRRVPGWIVDLAKAMADTTGLRIPLPGVIDAGYTYLGQLISHDIVPPTKLADGVSNVSPELNLDSLYGRMASNENYLVNGKFELINNERDLNRIAGKANIPEPRNDDNLIVAQLQVLWQRLHNAILESRGGYSASDAHDQVIRLFQCIVLEDYLRQILDPRVYQFCIVEGKCCFDFNTSPLDTLFTHAVFRFGHSMVRDFYKLQSGIGLGLGALFRPNERIQDQHVIHWPMFFSNDGRAQPSDAIDTLVAVDMSSIPPIDENSPTVNILIANILAGWQAKLPSGHDVVMDLIQGWNGLTQPDPALGLRRIGTNRMFVFGMNITDLPLWPYVLLEAEIHQRGLSLGVLGSLILGETIRNSIMAAEPSILRDGRHVLGDTLTSMGELGGLLLKISHSNRPSQFRDRPLTMAHILILLDELENSK